MECSRRRILRSQQTDNSMKQSEYQENTCKRRQAREYAYAKLNIGFGFTSFWPITGCSNAKSKQTRNTFNTQLKTAVIQTRYRESTAICAITVNDVLLLISRFNCVSVWFTTSIFLTDWRRCPNLGMKFSDSFLKRCLAVIRNEVTS